MYDRYEVLEHDAAYSVKFTWIVDVPRAAHGKPELYRMLRKEGDHYSKHEFAHMDSPTVKKSGKRHAVEQAVLNRLNGGPDSVKHGNNWLKVSFKGAVIRKVSERRKRALRPLYPIGAETKGSKFVMNFILDDDEAPVRYQVETPLDAFNDTDRWVYKVYRRTNPRGKGAPNYDMLVMSKGRQRVIKLYEEKHLYYINEHLDSLSGYVQKDDGITTRLLEQIRKRFNNAAAEYNHDNPTGKETVQMRLKAYAQAIGDKLFEAMRNPTGDNRSQWQMIIETMNANREKLTPKFEAHMESIKAQAILAKHSAKVAQAPQTTAGAFIPPFPPPPSQYAQTPPKASESPANGTTNPLTAFLGAGATPLTQTPSNAHQAEPSAAHHTMPTSDVPEWLLGQPEASKEPEMKPLGRDEVESWLANLPKGPVRPPEHQSQEPQAQLDGAHTSNALPETDTPVIPPIQKMHTLADVPLEAMLAQADAEYERQKAAGEI